ncbi:MAG: hypothetical protein AB3N23_00350 [Paracoccaceae bacterium]
MRPILCLVALVFTLAACSTKPVVYDDEAFVRSVSYRDPGPASITLYTIINNRSGSGAHTALLINASERVIFDPAGSFFMDAVPEQHDVLFGITRNIEFYYRSAHARSTFHVLMQTIEVTPEQAEMAYRLARANGPVGDAYCAQSTSSILSRIPGFESIKVTMFPNNLARQFAALPGVEEFRYYEEDDPDLQKALQENNARLNAAQKG